MKRSVYNKMTRGLDFGEPADISGVEQLEMDEDSQATLRNWEPGPVPPAVETWVKDSVATAVLALLTDVNAFMHGKNLVIQIGGNGEYSVPRAEVRIPLREVCRHPYVDCTSLKYLSRTIPLLLREQELKESFNHPDDYELAMTAHVSNSRSKNSE